MPIAVKKRLSDAISEKEFQGWVIDYAKLQGWRVYHTYDSRRCEYGYPDLTLVRERVVWAELKSARGTVTPEQRAWIKALATTEGEVYVWRPDDRDEIEHVLRK